ncbi:hemerythrin domain-containing protein [Bacillus sp. X1(2014)]|uniref:hemerythrin domain-containing protein n=1 Tax=Bacillus sp. X1(2014) TaxID=1565991 RepID=UPI0021B43E17|nr:hemerythrin domain-containing protein [Bacillus sp. X1(2014)]
MSGCMSGFGGMPQAELSKGLKQLKGEHSPLLKQLDDMYELTQKIDQEIDIETNFSALITSVKEFKAALDPHSEREEGVLFPMMGVYIGTTSGPIAVMEYEHDQAKSKIGEFLRNAENKPRSIEEKKKAAQLVQSAYFILTEHFSKEENVLFPMAERMLTDEQKEELYQKIQEI